MSRTYEVPSKPWWQSKTVWANVLALVAAVAVEMQGWEFMPPGWETGLAGVVAVVNLGLRTITKEPISLKAEK